jgi:hypothetical protein
MLLPVFAKRKSPSDRDRLTYFYPTLLSTMAPIQHRYRSPTSCIWKLFKKKSDEKSVKELRKRKTHVSIFQALTMAALAATCLAWMFISYFSTSLPNMYSDQLVAAATRGGVISQAPYYPTSPSTSWKVGISGLDQYQADTEVTTSRVEQERQDASTEEEDQSQVETEVATSRVEQERQDALAEEEAKDLAFLPIY